ncbi:MAG: non-homologous end-joining DNA ligase [Candidatus Micrarchaeia archaeon]
MSLWNAEPKLVKPMLAFPAKPFNSKDFLMEIKYDGTRGIAYLDKVQKKSALLNRRGKFFEYRYPELRNLFEQVNAKRAILDGEVVVFENGKPNFYLLEEREQTSNSSRIELLSKIHPAIYVVFDVLHVDGQDLLSKPLIERKKILNELIEESDFCIISNYIFEEGVELFNRVKKRGLEGIMAKKISSLYQQGRSKDWLKIKATNTIDAIVIGYTKSEKEDLSALILGIYEDAKIRYIGRVGTGFNEEKRKELLLRLKGMKGYKYGFKIDLEPGKKAFFVKPELVAEVKYLEFTSEKILRAPSFVRIRDDKPAKECTLEGQVAD